MTRRLRYQRRLHVGSMHVLIAFVTFLYLVPLAIADDEPIPEPHFYVHFTDADGDPCSLLDTTMTLDDVNPSGNSSAPQYAAILVSDPGPFTGIQFGFEYGPDVEVIEWFPCWPTIEVPTEGFPGSGCGIAQAWGRCMNVREGELFVVGVFEIAAGSWGTFRTAGYTYESPASIENCERPVATIEIILSEDHAFGVVHDTFFLGTRLSRY